VKLSKLKYLVATTLLMVGACTQAETALEASIKKNLEPRLGDGTKIDSVTKTPYGGLYEVRVGGDILYTDEKGQYLFIGSVVDLKNSKNVTKARLDDINKVKFTDLPLDSAIKTVKGDGKRVIAVFEDPNCGYCKRLRKTLQSVDNVTIYTFLYNILTPESVAKSKDVWCSADKSKAWDEWMLSGKEPASSSDKCQTPHEKVLALGHKLNVTGTPTIFFADGTRAPGAVDAQALETKFASLDKTAVH
jgi:thiol:disulfide interchange protein DsbC